jgi:hypothetical protein
MNPSLVCAASRFEAGAPLQRSSDDPLSTALQCLGFSLILKSRKRNRYCVVQCVRVICDLFGSEGHKGYLVRSLVIHRCHIVFVVDGWATIETPTGFDEHTMNKPPADTTWQNALKDSQWQRFAGSSTNRMTQADVAQIRQIATSLFGESSRVFMREMPAEGGGSATHVMMESRRVLSDRLATQKVLSDRLRAAFERHKIKVLLIDPNFTLTEEHKRFRFAAREF